MRHVLHRLGSVPMLQSAASRAHKTVGLALLLLYGYFLQPAEFAVLVLLYLTTTLVETFASQGLTAQVLCQLGLHREAPVLRGHDTALPDAGRARKSPRPVARDTGANAGSDDAERRVAASTAFFQSLFVALVLFGVLALFARPLEELLFSGARHPNLLHLMILAGFLRSLQNFPRQMLRARRRQRLHAVLRLGEALLTASLSLYFLAVAGLGLRGVVYGEVLREILVTLLLLITLRHDLIIAYSMRTARAVLRAGLPRLQRQFPSLLLATNDRYVLAFYTSLPLLGIYAFGCRIAQGLGDLAVQPLLNLVPVLHRDADVPPPERSLVLGRFLTYFVALSGLLATAIAVFAEPILQILSAPGFLGASKILPLLLLALMLAGVQRLVHSAMLLEGTMPARLHHALIAVAVLSLTGNLLLVPRLGIWGAGLMAVAAQALLCAATLTVQRRHLGMGLEVGRLAKVAAALCSTYYISRFVMPEPLLGQLAAAAAMLFLYPALLGVLGFYTMAEIDKMRDLLNRRVIFLPEKGASPPSPQLPVAAQAPELAGAAARPGAPETSR